MRMSWRVQSGLYNLYQVVILRAPFGVSYFLHLREAIT